MLKTQGQILKLNRLYLRSQICIFYGTFTWLELQGTDTAYSMDNKVQHMDYMAHHKCMDLLHYPNRITVFVEPAGIVHPRSKSVCLLQQPHCKQSSNSAEEVLQIQIVQREWRKMRPLHCFGFFLQEFKHIQRSGCYAEFTIASEGLYIKREIRRLIESQQTTSWFINRFDPAVGQTL